MKIGREGPEQLWGKAQGEESLCAGGQSPARKNPSILGARGGETGRPGSESLGRSTIQAVGAWLGVRARGLRCGLQ